MNAAAEKNLSPEAYKNLTLWLTDPLFVEFTDEINSLLSSPNWQAIEDAFYTHISVGTGGIRGPLGVGPNRINRRTIGEAAQGLADFIKDFGPDAIARGVVVGHEVRMHAREFAEMCCEVFAANGIKTYLFESFRATPEISFAVRHLETTAGVMITASHNPRTDNGFKFYWSDGGQVVPPLDQKFMQLVNNVREVQSIPLATASGQEMVRSLGHDIDEAYLTALSKLSLTRSRSATITFSPMHGAGSTNILPILETEGFTVKTVDEQIKPDGTFPTAVSDVINPEFPQVVALALRRGTENNSDLVIVSDPDADRAAVAAKINLDESGVERLSGNEVGAALTHFMLSQLKAKNQLSPSSLVLKTYVTTSLIEDIANSFGVRVIGNLPVGFKFIAEIIEKLHDKNDFVFAAEESLGYLAGTFVRDKDGAIASLLIAELVSTLKDRGTTLFEYLDEIYQTIGYYKNILKPIELKGKIGKEKITAIMQGLRAHPPQMLGERAILKINDTLDPQLRDPNIYKVGKGNDQITLVFSNDERSRVTIRPSGTEPTIKCYIQNFVPASNQNIDDIKKQGNDEAASLEKAIIYLCEDFAQTVS